MITQAGRHIRVNTNLGEDKLFLESFEGEERVSDLFRFELGVLTDDPAFSMDSLLNKPVVVSMNLHDDTDRNFHGIINHIDEVETRVDGHSLYRATMVPWTWLLTLFNDCRIFQNKSVPDIVEQVFRDRGFTDFANRLNGSYQPREYTVQYRETDFNFISRLLEEEGIFYFFEHTADKHTLVMADQASAFVDCPSQSSAAYDTTAGLWQDVDVVLGLRRTRQIRVGKVTENDYDFKKPRTSIDADLDSALCQAVGKLEKQIVNLRSRWRDTHRDAKVVRETKEGWNGSAAVPVETEAAKPVKTRSNGRLMKPKVFRVNYQEDRKPMTLEEAMLEMEGEQHYVVFRDAHRDCLSVLVRRADGNYDLIES